MSTPAPLTKTALNASDPVTTFLARFGLRDVGHFLAPFAATLATLLGATSLGDLKTLGFAAIPGVAAVAFRQLFPHTTVSAAEVGSAVATIEKVTARIVPVTVQDVVAAVGTDVSTAAAVMTPVASPAVAPAPVATPPVS